MRKIKFSTGEYYHIYNRGVEKRDIFLENSDFWRFLAGMRELNNDDTIRNFGRRYLSKANLRSEGKELVGIVCYCLMPNHFHFILHQLEDKGISKFMHKMGTAYTKYFNLKHERSGVLFQGTFQAKHIENEQYLLHLSRYIHLNPLEVPPHSNDGFNSKESLKSYKWSSLPFYLDRDKNNLINLDNGLIIDQFKDTPEYEDFLFSNSTFSLDVFELLKMET